LPVSFPVQIIYRIVSCRNIHADLHRSVPATSTTTYSFCLTLQCTIAPVSVQHVRDISRVDTLKELFKNVESINVVAFIKDTNFYHCI